MKSIVFYLLVFLGMACTKQVNMSSSNQSNDDWTIGNTTLNEKGIAIPFTNASNNQLNVLEPMSKQVEMLVNGEWVKVSIFYCDCGLSCPAPPDSRTFESGELLTFSWDLLVEECINTEDGKSSTVKTKASPGNYRVTYTYQLPNTRASKSVTATFKLGS